MTLQSSNPSQPDVPLDTDYLNAAGLNIHAVLNLADLPEETHDHFSQLGLDLSGYRQLILIGHKGTQLWQRVAEDIPNKTNTIDDYSVWTIRQLFETHYPAIRYQFIYPGDKAINLQKLGQYAGWHHASPFRIGIHREWGSWFAYRAVVLANSNFTPQGIITGPKLSESPCVSCESKPCITACPADACNGHQTDLDKCLSYRKQEDSPCRYTCLAREACPVGRHLQYCEEQMRYHYSISLKMIIGG